MRKIKDPEEFLRKLSLKPPPEALKKKILDAAEQEQKGSLYLKPVFWKAFLLTSILSLIIFIFDNRVNHIQVNNLTSELGISQVHKNEIHKIQKELIEEIFQGVFKGKNLPWLEKYLTPENQKEKPRKNINLNLFFEEKFYED